MEDTTGYVGIGVVLEDIGYVVDFDDAGYVGTEVLWGGLLVAV